MSYTERFSEQFALLDEMVSDSYAVGVHDSGYVSLANYARAVVVIQVGEMQSAATFDVDVEQATDTSGTSAKAITDKSITQMTQAGGDGDETALVEILCDELDVDNGFDCINVEVTVGVDAVEASVLVIGYCAHYEPVTHGYAEVVT